MSYSLLVYTFTLGMATTVNPCGFPLLPAYLSILVSSSNRSGDLDNPGDQRNLRGTTVAVMNALLAGVLVSVGFLAVFGVMGVLLESGFTVFMEFVPWVMIPVAILLVGYGAFTFSGRALPISVPVFTWNRSRDSGTSWMSMVLFGIYYASSSLTCSLPIFIAGVIPFHQDRSLFGVASGMLAFLAGMAALLVALSIAVALAGTSFVNVLRRASRYVEKVAAALLVAAGAYLVDYWVSYLVSPTRANAPVHLVESWQSVLATWVPAHSSQIALLALLLAGVAAGGALAARRRRIGAAGGSAGRQSGDRPFQDSAEMVESGSGAKVH
ncbi:MAG: cytochrome c biogenesis CcdA family protein [Acidimicrobiales bacterium]